MTFHATQPIIAYESTDPDPTTAVSKHPREKHTSSEPCMPTGRRNLPPPEDQPIHRKFRNSALAALIAPHLDWHQPSRFSSHRQRHHYVLPYFYCHLHFHLASYHPRSCRHLVRFLLQGLNWRGDWDGCRGMRRGLCSGSEFDVGGMICRARLMVEGWYSIVVDRPGRGWSRGTGKGGREGGGRGVVHV